MPARPTSHSKNKHLQQIIKTINNIQQTILQRIQQSESKQQYSSTPCKQSRKHRAYSQRASLNTKNIQLQKTRTKTQANTSFSLANSILFLQSLPKQITNIDMNTNTPKRKKRNTEQSRSSPFRKQFDSPFDKCVFQKSQTVRKFQTPAAAKQNRKESQGSIWQKYKKKHYLQKLKTSRQRIIQQPPSITSNRIQKLCQNQLTNRQLQEAACKLQLQFQNCLMAKRLAPLPDQPALRERMSDLSLRIAALRERQIKII